MILLGNSAIVIGGISASVSIVVIALPVILLVLCIMLVWLKRNVKKNKDELELGVMNKQQVTVGPMIRTGQFVTVYHAKRNDRNVSIAIYRSNRDGHTLWNRERYIYSLPMIEHENVLKFIHSEDGNATELRIVYEDVSHGSLRQYLQRNTLTSKQLSQLAHTAAKGLCHLHKSEQGRSPIAHRDVNSDNILVKSGLTCVISNFSVAVECDNMNKPSIDIQV